jgi:hypothetical protein
VRVKVTDQEAQSLRERPVAKGKASSKQREAERELQTNVKVIRTKKADSNAKPELHSVPGSSLRAVMEESIARVYSEIFSGMSTHDEQDKVTLEISEEAYVLALTMVVGNDIDTPRQGLRIKDDDKASSTMKSCRECAA